MITRFIINDDYNSPIEMNLIKAPTLGDHLRFASVLPSTTFEVVRRTWQPERDGYVLVCNLMEV